MTIRFGFLAILLAGFLARPAAAHSLGIECKLAGDQVQVEAFYSDNTPAADAAITVKQGDRTVAQGRADAQGRWAFARPAAGTYDVAADAGAGHRKQIKMTIPAAGAEGTAAARNEPDSPCCCCGPDDGLVVSDGPHRQEFTRFPWAQAGVGCGLLGVVGLGFWLARLRHRPGGSTPKEQP